MGAGARLLHRIALSFDAVLETSFDLERARFGRAAAALPLCDPVFVCGLARAGTSLTTRLLDASGAFATPSYRDMPFALAPNSWFRLSGGARRTLVKRERGHGDGMDHDLDSPEAIEEVFWRCFESEAYIKCDRLEPASPSEETIARYRDYVALVALRAGRNRYLSKNNNNVLRLSAIVAAFPDALLIHPFRDPLEHAASLLEQHRRALALHAGDPFRASYMRWLVHHEFGADHRPFELPGAPCGGDDQSPDYWLANWCSTYRHLLKQAEPARGRQYFLDFDEICADPVRGLSQLAMIAGLQNAADIGSIKRRSRNPEIQVSPDLLAEARTLHGAMRERNRAFVEQNAG
jgi:hypothetical protein